MTIEHDCPTKGISCTRALILKNQSSILIRKNQRFILIRKNQSFILFRKKQKLHPYS